MVAAACAARHSAKTRHRVSRRSERNLHDEGREEDAGDEHALHQASETVHPEDECGNQGQGDPLILHRCSVT